MLQPEILLGRLGKLTSMPRQLRVDPLSLIGGAGSVKSNEAIWCQELSGKVYLIQKVHL